MATYRIGEVEFDPSRWELRRGGEPVALERLPMELLALLIERQGVLVTRAQIEQRLWPGVNVETEQGIHTAIRKVRRALGDDPSAPRFVHTVVGRGYRFEGAVPVRAAPSRAGPRVAVLPFANLSGDPAQADFADGIADLLLTELARQPGLQVLSRTTAFCYRGTTQPLTAIAARISADAVIEGSVLRKGDRVRINVQLVDGRSDAHLWAQEYQRHLREVFEVQAEVARNVAARVQGILAPSASAAPRAAAVEARAFEHYLRGRALARTRTERGLADAVVELRRACDLDPGFAAAWSALGDAFAALGYTSFRAPGETFPAAEEAARSALALDDTLSEAHAVLGYVHLYYRWDRERAEAALLRAVSLNPNDASAHHWLSVLLTAAGRHAEAAERIAQALSLDPLSPILRTDVGFEHYYAGRTEAAVAQLREVLRVAPEFALAHLWLGRALQRQGLFAEAIAEFDRTGPHLRDWPVLISARAHACGEAGRFEEARAALARLDELRASRYVTSYAVALVHHALGDRELAFRWLDLAVDERTHWLVWLALDPRFDGLRGDPRFDGLLRRIGL